MESSKKRNDLYYLIFSVIFCVILVILAILNGSKEKNNNSFIENALPVGWKQTIELSGDEYLAFIAAVPPKTSDNMLTYEQQKYLVDKYTFMFVNDSRKKLIEATNPYRRDLEKK